MGGGTGAIYSKGKNLFTEAQAKINKWIEDQSKNWPIKDKIEGVQYGDITNLYTPNQLSDALVAEVTQYVPNRYPGHGVTTNLDGHFVLTYWLVDMESKSAEKLSVKCWIYAGLDYKESGLEFEGELLRYDTRVTGVEFIHTTNGALEKLRFELRPRKEGFNSEINL
ncbi:MAG: hypothetical protein WD335_01620 [Candidatus Paceibacterota bacterium]